MTTQMRYAGAFLSALLVAFALFWLMTVLISRGGGDLGERRDRVTMNFIRIDDQTTQVQERRREPPPPPEKPRPVPQIEALPTPQTQTPQAPPLDLPMPDFRPSLAMGGIPVAAAPAAASGPVAYSQPLTPVSQVPPMYPRRAQMDGISGWVRLTFIINEDGSVRDIEVVEASPRRGIFDHEASRALARWKFNPQTVDGRPVPATATITINFNMER